MALIVNADDLGMSDAVNAAIREAFDAGIIDRTTLMVNMPKAEDAVRLAKEAGFIDRVGLHLNLTSGKPLTDRLAKDPIMCNSAGEFTADFARKLKTRFFLPRDTEDAVEGEIRAQLDRYRELGGVLWHIDSHHHVHTDPSIWKILKKVIRDYPVKSVRLGRNMFTGPSLLNRLFKFILNASIRRRCEIRPDLFGSRTDFDAYAARGMERLQGRNVEVMVHPVYDTAHVLSDIRSGEYFELTRPNIM